MIVQRQDPWLAVEKKANASILIYFEFDNAKIINKSIYIFHDRKK